MKDKTLMAEFSSMMESQAWKKLDAWSKEERESSLKRTDGTSVTDLSLGMVCEERGIRKGILKVIQYAENCRAGL